MRVVVGFGSGFGSGFAAAPAAAAAAAAAAAPPSLPAEAAGVDVHAGVGAGVGCSRVAGVKAEEDAEDRTCSSFASRKHGGEGEVAALSAAAVAGATTPVVGMPAGVLWLPPPPPSPTAAVDTSRITWTCLLLYTASTRHGPLVSTGDRAGDAPSLAGSPEPTKQAASATASLDLVLSHFTRAAPTPLRGQARQKGVNRKANTQTHTYRERDRLDIYVERE